MNSRRAESAPTSAFLAGFPVPQPLYTTDMGEAYVGDSLNLLRQVPDESVDLVLISPPFALVRKKSYGNADEVAYLRWFLPFTRQIWRVLSPRGSFVLELGWVYKRGRPVRSLYNIEVLLSLCGKEGWLLAQEFFWFNTAKLPTPAEWVTIRRIRVKDAVSPIWWLSKTENPKANWAGVSVNDDLDLPLDPVADPNSLWYGNEALLQQEDEIPSNLLAIPNTTSRSWYLDCCQDLGIKAHPARFPEKLPAFFIRGLTSPGDVVLDCFAGSNTTGAVAQKLGRRWVAFEQRHDFLTASAFRFLPQRDHTPAREVYRSLNIQRSLPLVLGSKQGDQVSR